MPDLEQLERRKRELELKRDIARLERNEKIADVAASISNEAKNVSVGISHRVAAAAAGTIHGGLADYAVREYGQWWQG